MTADCFRFYFKIFTYCIHMQQLMQASKIKLIIVFENASVSSHIHSWLAGQHWRNIFFKKRKILILVSYSTVGVPASFGLFWGRPDAPNLDLVCSTKTFLILSCGLSLCRSKLHCSLSFGWLVVFLFFSLLVLLTTIFPFCRWII